MRLKLKVLFSAVLLLCFSQIAGADDLVAQANEHYALREDKAELQQAITLLEEALNADPKNYQAAWRLARARWYEGNFAVPAKKRASFEKGAEAGRTAVEINPGDCLGHFWLGVNLALQAEAGGMFQALGLIDSIKQQMNRTIEIDPNCECGGAQRVLGKLHSKIPFFKGGSKTKAISYLNESLKICSNDTQSRIFLAEIYADDGKKSLAIQQLKLVLKQEPDPDWIPETRANQEIAKKMLSELAQK